MAASADAWAALLELSRRCRAGEGPEGGMEGGTELRVGDRRVCLADAGWSCTPAADAGLTQLLDLYLSVAQAGRTGFVVAHLGQSLDGRIAAANGASRWVTGEEDVRHNHRMRALADAVLVGAGTVAADDPLLTVRDCAGPNPVRVVLDPGRRLDASWRVFRDGLAPTVLVVAGAGAGATHGTAEVLALPPGPDGALDPAAIVAALRARGLRRLFVEGGGRTVSRFLAAGALDRLQIAVSPLIIGSGRPSITLPEITDLRQGLRPRVRRFALGEDVLFDCDLRATVDG